MPSLPRIKNTDSYSQRDRKINDAFSFIEELGESTFTTVVPTSAQLMVIGAAGSITNKGLGTHYSSASPYQNLGDAGLFIPNDNSIVRSSTIINAGTGYVSAPTLTIDDPYVASVWSGATTYNQNDIVFVIGGDTKKRFYKATTTIASGGSAPSHLLGITSNWLFIGRTAQASVSINSGQLNVVTIDDGGFGYISTPNINLSGGGGSNGAITPRMYSDITLFLNINAIDNKVNITSLTDVARASDYLLVHDTTSQSLKKVSLSIITPDVPTGAILFGSPTDSYTWDSANLFWNDTLNRLGINTNTPSYPLDVIGNVNAYGNYHIDATVVLTATTLGSGVLNSSLQTLGTISTGVWNGTIIAGQYGGTGVNNSGKTITISGNTVIGSSTHTVSLLTSANTSVTLPITGTLATLAGLETLTNKTLAAGSNTITGLTNGNLSGSAAISNANLANSTIQLGSTSIALGASASTLAGLASVTSTSFVGTLTGNASTATTLQTARTITLAGDLTSSAVAFDGSGNITISATVISSTFPNIQYVKSMNLAANSGLSLSSIVDPGTNAHTFTIGVNSSIAGTGLTFTSGVLNVIGTANRITANADSIDISSSYVGQSSITTLGTITSGTWNATIISPTHGGTGVNNGVRTISLGGNLATANSLTTSGNFPLVLTVTNNTNITFPTAGTLTTTTGTGATGTWGINITGSAATASTASTATTATNVSGGTVNATTGSFTGKISGSGSLSSGSIGNPTGGLGAIEIISAGGANASFIGFHRPGSWAAYFGLDSDNQFKIGGWSMGGVAYPLLHSNNFNSYAPTLTGVGASGTWPISITGQASALVKTVPAGSFENLIECTMAANDYFRVRCGGANNAGEVEFATADDAAEPLYFRQYTGNFATLVRTATILDASGNTTFPGIVTAGTYFVGNLVGFASASDTANFATTANFANTANSATMATSLINPSVPQNFRSFVTADVINAAAGDIIDVFRVTPTPSSVILPNSPTNGTAIEIINNSGQQCTIFPNSGGSNTIDGTTSYVLTPPASARLYFANTGDGVWKVLKFTY
jgi:hypothetical protein